MHRDLCPGWIHRSVFGNSAYLSRRYPVAVSFTACGISFHPNWKMTETHMVYWELFPTIDHLIPVARGGADDESNWVTTSMLHNSAKSNWTLKELGWPLLPPGDFKQWDGLLGWFVAFLQQQQLHLADKYIRRWHRAALAVQPVVPSDQQAAARRLPLVSR